MAHGKREKRFKSRIQRNNAIFMTKRTADVSTTNSRDRSASMKATSLRLLPRNILKREDILFLIAQADKAFRSIDKKITSGDPDLLVYNENTGDRFSVEVKENDQVTDNQRILFPLIKTFLCPRICGEGYWKMNQCSLRQCKKCRCY